MPSRGTPIFKPFWLAATAGWCAFLFTLSSIQIPPSLYVFNWQDLVAHAAVYLILYVLAAKGAPGLSRWWVLLFVVLYGISDEWHQYFVPGRVCDIRDVLADAAGGTIGVAIQHTRMGRRFFEGRIGGGVS